ncbi:MAG TPA: XamI family restriction endonuclease, partial [Candidatus Dormibacteraeota bacterium]|nr:XamI family restriction endonuclease [Candidatus Dormibacteraeota bacterium]
DELRVNIPIDVAIQPHRLRENKLPLLVEAKSAGDYTNTNKRRKEEATKIRQLRAKYGEEVKLVLFLCGYFDSGYLGYEAAEGLDWVWEHRIDDFEQAVL